MKQESKRKRYLDAAKGWGMLMIMYGHITRMSNPFDRYFSTYKITIFFIISGILLHMTGSMKRYSFGAFVQRNFRAIGIPYVCYSLLFMLYQLLLDLSRGRGMDVITSHLLNRGYLLVSLRGFSTMWFLSALFLGELFFAWAWRQNRWVRILAGALILPACFPVHGLLEMLETVLSSGQYKLISYPILTVSRGIMASGYIAVGFLLSGLLAKVRGAFAQFSAGLTLTLVNLWLSRYLSGADLNHMRFGRPFPLYILCSILGPIGILLLFRAVEHWYSMPVLSWTGRNSLIIMATHGTLGFKNMCYNGWNMVYTLAEKGGWTYGLQCIGIEAHLLLLEAGVVQVVNRYYPFLAGKGFSGRKKKETDFVFGSAGAEFTKSSSENSKSEYKTSFWEVDFRCGKPDA